MKIAVVGGRNFGDGVLLKTILDQHAPTQIISGGANGADTLAYHYARKRGITFRCHPPLEDEVKAIGFSRAAKRRNLRIVVEAELLIAFPDRQSRGTYHTINLAKRMKIPVRVISPK